MFDSLYQENTVSYGDSASFPYFALEGTEEVQLDKEKGSGQGLSFSPLPGFQITVREPASLAESVHKKHYFDAPVVAASLFVNGKCSYSLKGESDVSIDVDNNMFIVGRWNNEAVEQYYPAQDNCAHIEIVIQESSMEKYFGSGMSTDILESLRQAMHSGSEEHCTITGIARPDVLIAAKQILDRKKKGGIGYMLYWTSILNLITKLFHSLAAADVSSSLIVQDDDRERLTKLKMIIEEEFCSIKSTSDLCSMVGISFSKANKVFKDMYCMTIFQYIQQCKMVYAHSMLMHRQLNVSECAFAVGYSNISHFISAFKKHYGVTPKAVSCLKWENSMKLG